MPKLAPTKHRPTMRPSLRAVARAGSGPSQAPKANAAMSAKTKLKPKTRAGCPCFGVEPLARFHARSEEHTSELQSQSNLVCRLLLEKKKETQVESDLT